MTAYKNLMQRRASFRCPGRPPRLQHFRYMPGPKRALRVKTRYFEPGAQKRIREKNAAEFAKTCKEIEERMTKRQHRRRYGDTTPTAPPMGQVIYLFVDTQHRGVASTTGNW